jgi:hypothetical protein
MALIRRTFFYFAQRHGLYINVVCNAQMRMIRGKNIPSTLLVFMGVTSCSLFDSGGETIKGHYNIGWVDTKSNRSISYASEDGGQGGSEKIGAFIKRMGHDDRYIIAERIHYESFVRTNTLDSGAFYIIDMGKASPYDNSDVFGPFTTSDFEKKKAELGIQTLEFTEEYSF